MGRSQDLIYGLFFFRGIKLDDLSVLSVGNRMAGVEKERRGGTIWRRK
jgi:hypothetical protein